MKDNETTKLAIEQLRQHGIEFGKRYRDKASRFEGTATAIYFYEHACVRVNLRGTNKSTGAAIEFTFDAPELEVADDGIPVPAGTRTGGPHDLTTPTR